MATHTRGSRAGRNLGAKLDDVPFIRFGKGWPSYVSENHRFKHRMQERNRTSVIKRICLVNKSLVEVERKAVICSTRDILRPAGLTCFSRKGHGWKYEENGTCAAGVLGNAFAGRSFIGHSFNEPGLFTTDATCTAATGTKAAAA